MGRRGRLAPDRLLLLDVPGDLAPRRLDQDHPSWNGDHLRALRLDYQPRRCADGDGRDLRSRADIDEVIDALVVDLPREGTDGWMPLFVVLRQGAMLDDALVGEIRRRIREDCSPRHIPNEIRQIAAVPRTLSNKVLEVPVKRILMGPPRRRRRPVNHWLPRSARLLLRTREILGMIRPSAGRTASDGGIEFTTDPKKQVFVAEAHPSASHRRRKARHPSAATTTGGLRRT